VSDRITFWKCSECHGTGRVFVCVIAKECYKCDGTGNALIDGAEERHKRRLSEFDRRSDEAR